MVKKSFDFYLVLGINVEGFTIIGQRPTTH